MVWRYQKSVAASGELDGASMGDVESALYNTGARTLENAVVTRTGSARKAYGTRYVAGVASDKKARVYVYHAQAAGVDLKVACVFTDDELYLYDAETEAALNSGAAIAIPYQEDDLEELYFLALPEELAIYHEDYETRSLSVSAGSPYTFTFGIFDTADSGPRLNAIRKPVRMARGTAHGLELFDWDTSTDFWRETDSDSIFWMENGFVHVRNAGLPVFVNPRKMKGNSFTNNFPASAASTENWQGLWQQGSNVAEQVSIPSNSTLYGASTITKLSGTFAKSDVGKILDPTPINNPYVTLFLIVNYLTTTTVTGLLIRGSWGGGAGNASHRMYTLQQRDRLSRAFLTPSAKTGTITIYADLANTFEAAMVSATEREPVIYFNGGSARLVSVVSGTEATATVIQTLTHQVPTTNWSMTPNFAYGFPSWATVHQNRLTKGGFKGRFGKTLAMSRTDDYHNFTVGSADDEALVFDVIGNVGRIVWGKSGVDLIFGSDKGVFRLAGNPVTPTALGVDSQSEDGGATAFPVQIGTAIHFADRDRDSILETRFRFDSERYEARVVSEHAKHLFQGGSIRDQVLTTHPERHMLVVRNGASVVSMSRDDAFGVLAFNSWEGLKVISASVVPLALLDRVWLCVERVINGNTKRYLEVLDTAIPRLRSAKLFSSPISTTLTGLGHLEGETVRINIDGTDVGTATVASAQTTIPYLGTTVYVGKAVPYKLRPQYIPGTGDEGPYMGRKEGVGGAVLLLTVESIGGTVNGKALVPVPESQLRPPSSRYKWVEAMALCEAGAGPGWTVEHEESTPFEVVAVNTDYTGMGGA